MMRIIERYDRQFEYAGVLMDVVIAYQFFSIWHHPTMDDLPQLGTLSLLMIFEFIMVHSGVFMAVMPKKISLFVLIPFYGVFAWAMNNALDDNTVMYIYLMVVFNRMRFAFSDVSIEIRNRAFYKSVMAAMMYFFMIFIFVFGADYIPKLGLTEEFISLSGYGKDLKYEGAFVDLPHSAMAFGVFYYCGLALIEALLLKRTFAPKTSSKSITS